ncbi:MAG: sulfite exporter TauE/SafE family protein [Candidatus Dadabacteria bacterium]|nr:MAG: sulfite exporter TauE/SafE family protein [Candidatus Dadabacteria bacterium]
MTWAILPALGLGAGLAAGFLGIGGGVFLAPAFLELFRWFGFPPGRVPTALGTSKAVVLLAAISALRAQARADQVEWPLVRRLAPFVVLGAAAGGALGTSAAPGVIQLLFGVFLMVLGLGQWARGILPPLPALAFTGLRVLTAGAAAVAATFGIGGGVLLVPLLAGPGRLPAHRAAGTAAGIMVFSASTAAASYVALGLARGNPIPGAIGYLHLPTWALAGVPALAGARWGAAWGRRAPARALRVALGFVLLAVGTRILLAR